jgi:hypothetical protein
MVTWTRGTSSYRVVLMGVLLLLGGADPADAQSACTTTNGNQVVNGLLSGLEPILNAAWPSVAKSTGVEPLNLGQITVDLPHDVCDPLCVGVAALWGADWCHFHVTTQIVGLSELNLTSLSSTSLTATSGTLSCPYKPPKSFTNSCSFQGQAAGDAALLSGEALTVNGSKVTLGAECDWGVYSGYVQFWPISGSGTIKCTATKASGSAKMNECSGLCQSGTPNAAIEALQVANLNINIGGVSCEVSPGYSPVSWVAEELIPLLEDEITSAVTTPIENALNSLLKPYIPYPTTCN